jgi:hypothetical protein
MIYIIIQDIIIWNFGYYDGLPKNYQHKTEITDISYFILTIHIINLLSYKIN